MRWAAVVLGVVGGVIGTAAAFMALGAASSGPAPPQREWLGMVGLGCALLTGLAALAARRSPRLAAPVMMAAGILGCAAMNLFYAETSYLVALPFWLFGGVFAHLAPRPPS